MPRGDYRFKDAPFQTWDIGLDDQHRVRLPLDVMQVVSWLDAQSRTIECAASLGGLGEVQLEPLERYEAARSEYMAALGDSRPMTADSGRRSTDGARLLSASWRVLIGVDGNRMNITVPEPTRHALQIADTARERRVVVFGFGEILEIWNATQWNNHIRSIANRSLTISQATEDLE